MFCSRCGAENSDASTMCRACGGPLAVGATGRVVQAGGQRVGNNLVWAILATLFCCLPTGIVAIVYAAKVDALATAGDVSGARAAASSAATWSWISFALGLVLMTVGPSLALLT